MMKSLSYLFLIALVVGMLSCMSDAPKQAKKPLNPNGDSELALLMREMFDNGMEIKKRIAQGEKLTLSFDPNHIFTAQATEPDKAASEAYRNFGESYIAAVEAYKNAEPENVSEAYEIMVNTCMNCHRSLCPGPTVRIAKLY